MVRWQRSEITVRKSQTSLLYEHTRIVIISILIERLTNFVLVFRNIVWVRQHNVTGSAANNAELLRDCDSFTLFYPLVYSNRGSGSFQHIVIETLLIYWHDAQKQTNKQTDDDKANQAQTMCGLLQYYRQIKEFSSHDGEKRGPNNF